MATATPNVLLIHCHDLGQYLGCYGAPIETPNVDALAAEGVRFENHFGTAPQCSPSRGSLMTGCYPHVNGLMGLAHGEWELNDDERILPHYLAEAGYETHLFGLQHITQDTDRLGYEYVHSEGNLYPGVSPAVHQVNRATNVTDVVTTFLEKRAFDAPFFASVGFFELHRVEESNGRYGFQRGRYDADDPDDVGPLSYLPDRRGIRQDLSEMHGMVYAIDDAVGRIRTCLAETGLDEETLVVFTTEHGIAFPRAKGTCYDPGVEAALIMSHPELASGGREFDALVSNVDVTPTLLDLLDVPLPTAVNGRSFRPLLSGADDEHRDELFLEMTWHDMYNPIRAIRTDRFKYIRNFWYLPRVYLPRDVFASESGREVREAYAVPTRPFEELYDLYEGPTEVDNVANEPRYEDRRRDLAERLHTWMVETDDPLLDGPIPPGDFDTIMAWPTDAG
ncbi:arylsulfatase A family protein [Halovivax ruber XH-70]|uniref:Arylsulfatase A family protein n=1 Tax=Halovivax ruber (strain DSM 18193 / JCM 13892 / XH-70) TaxID=797302 RepID=L0IBF0_HALRX|nr:sulfatase [Halovivax ruber]AGB15571.1 arylsulfatase A family protein [Halovivax ruber XH-70]